MSSGLEVHQRMRIVLAEADPLIADLVMTILHIEGFQVVHALDGCQELSLVRETQPALVIRNVHLSDRDGLAMVETLRADPELVAIPVILMSTDPGKVTSTSDSDAAVLELPFHPDALRTLIAEQLEHRAL